MDAPASEHVARQRADGKRFCGFCGVSWPCRAKHRQIADWLRDLRRATEEMIDAEGTAGATAPPLRARGVSRRATEFGRREVAAACRFRALRNLLALGWRP